MKGIYRIGHFIFIFCLLIAFVGCSTNAGTQSTSVPTTKPEQTAAANETAPAPSDADPTESPNDPFGKYDPPIDITGCRVLASWMGFDAGEDVDNNWWTRIFMDKLGIRFTQLWTAPNWGDDMSQKFNVALATDNLPDVMCYCDSNMAMKAINAGKVADLTQVFDQYASPFVKEITGLADGQSLNAWTIDGKLCAIAQPRAEGTDFGYVWIRSDWLDALDLAMPTTFDELENVAREFTQKNPGGASGNYGFAFGKQLSMIMDANRLSACYQAYPGLWMESGGQLVCGSIQPEIKAVWEKAAQWYEEGLIPEDFAVRDEANEINQDILNDKVGIQFGGTNDPNGAALRDWRKLNTDLSKDWVWMRVPSATDKPATVGKIAQYDSFCMVNSECSHPEAVVKMINLASQIYSVDKPDYIEHGNFDFNTSPGGNMVWWDVTGLRLDDPRPKDYTLYLKALDGEISPEDLPETSDNAYPALVSWRDENVNAENFDLNWSLWKLEGPGGTLLDQRELYQQHPESFVWSPFWGNSTPAMTQYSNDWGNKRLEFATKAIMNGNVDEEFNNWVEYFNTNGGTDAAIEVNQWYQEHK